MAAPREPRIGAFVLQQPLARGGMGEVWTAHHHRQGWSAAAKVLTADGLQDEAMVRALRAEIRAAAALTHPSVIRVHDAGEIGEETAALTGLRAGSPWFVMELAEGGTLLDRPPQRWDDVLRVTLELLDALAHAHARGVVHRDLKPDNVLFTGDGDLRLADFGLVLLGGTAVHPAAGTPQFMAPEQFTGAREGQGPWTDLYAVGCLVWWMATGHAPFRAVSLRHLMRAHLTEPPPELEPAMAVPAGLERWLRRLLQKDPAVRYRRAADAAAVLARLPAPTSATTEPMPRGDRRSPTLVTLVPELAETPVLRDGPEGSDTTLAPRPSHRVPESWRELAMPAVRPGASGLGLVGLSEPPLVGRGPERDVLWDALKSVAQRLRPRAVVLVGDAGVGKSRLAQWLCRTAHELGIASVLVAFHDPGRPEGLVPMLRRGLHLPAGLRGAALRDALAARGHDDPDALAELLDPGAAPRLLDTAERRIDIIRDTILGLADDRVPVVWLDDAHHAADAAGVAQRILDGKVPTLLLVTGAAGEGAVAGIAEHPNATVVDVGPLPEADRASLIERWVQVAPDDARRLARCAEGNPLFAVQLVDDVVARGHLQGETVGWVLGPAASLPTSRADLWTMRVQAALRHAPPDWAVALELAALLGPQVHGPTWRAACSAAGCPDAADPLLVRLFDLRLAVPEPGTGGDRWHLAHGELVEPILEPARAAGALAARHAACAAALASGGGPDAERRAAHHQGAGDAEAEVGSLLEARIWRSGFDLRGAAGLAARAAEVAHGSLDEDHRLRTEVELAVARSAAALHDPEGFAGALERALELADAHRHKGLAAEAHRELAADLYRRGQLGHAAPQLEHTIRLLRTHGVEAGQVPAWLDLARIRHTMRQAAKALDAAVRGFNLAERTVPDAVPEAAAVLATCLLGAGRLGDAEVVLEGRLAALDPERDRRVMAELHAAHGSVARARGEPAAAVGHLRTAMSLSRLAGSPRLDVELALIDALLEEDEVGEAAATLSLVRDHFAVEPALWLREASTALRQRQWRRAQGLLTDLEAATLPASHALAADLEAAATPGVPPMLRARMLRLALAVWGAAGDDGARTRVRTTLAELTLAEL